MYLMYVDESGDCGISGSPTKYFMLSGLVIHELKWASFLNDLVEFRRQLRETKGLKLREEIHAAHFVSRPGSELIRIKRHERLDILRRCINWCVSRNDCRIINVVLDKRRRANSSDVFELAWKTLIQRFENTIKARNFPDTVNPDDCGMIIPDMTDNKQLQNLIRKMRRHNPIPHDRNLFAVGARPIPIRAVIEDPFFKQSNHSFFHQLVDVIVYFLRQKYEPNIFLHQKGCDSYFDKLYPILCRHASTRNSLGIVEL